MEQALFDRIYKVQRDPSRTVSTDKATHTRPMTHEQARAAWLRVTIGIRVPGVNDEGLIGWPGMTLTSFILYNAIELLEDEE